MTTLNDPTLSILDATILNTSSANIPLGNAVLPLATPFLASNYHVAAIQVPQTLANQYTLFFTQSLYSYRI